MGDLVQCSDSTGEGIVAAQVLNASLHLSLLVIRENGRSKLLGAVSTLFPRSTAMLQRTVRGPHSIFAG